MGLSRGEAGVISPGRAGARGELNVRLQSEMEVSSLSCLAHPSKSDCQIAIAWFLHRSEVALTPPGHHVTACDTVELTLLADQDLPLRRAPDKVLHK